MRNLFFRLPVDSETLCDIHEIPREARAWGVNTHMLANIFDITAAVNHHIVAANSKNPPRPPKPISRPKLKVEKKPKGFWPGKTIVDKEAVP